SELRGPEVTPRDLEEEETRGGDPLEVAADVRIDLVREVDEQMRRDAERSCDVEQAIGRRGRVVTVLDAAEVGARDPDLLRQRAEAEPSVDPQHPQRGTEVCAHRAGSFA